MHTLITIPYSHYCERARWAMDYSGLDYTEAGHAPFFHAYYNRKAGAKRTVPSLVTPEGVLTDSADILDYVHRSGATLYPEGQRANIKSWEHLFDRRLGVPARAWAYIYLKDAPEVVHELLAGGDARQYKTLKPVVPQLVKLIAKNYRATSGRRQYLENQLNAMLDQCDHVLRDGRRFFCGDTFTAADITLCSLFGVLLNPPEYGYPYPATETFPEAMQKQMALWSERPTGQYILNTYATQRNRKAI